MKKLKLYERSVYRDFKNFTLEDAFDLLGEYAGLYGDNGDIPDGNCWLPSNQGDIPEDIAAIVINAGLGELVEVQEYTSDEYFASILAQLVHPHITREEYVNLLKTFADTHYKWARYGAYGGDSYWVIIKPEEA